MKRILEQGESRQALPNESLAIEAEEATPVAHSDTWRARDSSNLVDAPLAATEFVRRNGAFHPDTRRFIDVGLPFGPKPRLLMAWLT